MPILKLIRNYAVSILSQLKEEELIYDLLFLVQALRYEGEDNRSNLLSMLVEKGVNNKSNQIASLLYWYLKTESEPLPAKEAKTGK